MELEKILAAPKISVKKSVKYDDGSNNNTRLKGENSLKVHLVPSVYGDRTEGRIHKIKKPLMEQITPVQHQSKVHQAEEILYCQTKHKPFHRQDNDPPPWLKMPESRKPCKRSLTVQRKKSWYCPGKVETGGDKRKLYNPETNIRKIDGTTRKSSGKVCVELK